MEPVSITLTSIGAIVGIGYYFYARSLRKREKMITEAYYNIEYGYGITRIRPEYK